MKEIGFVLVWCLFCIPSCIVLNEKNRGTWYYVLTFLSPFIGLIVALCLSKTEPGEGNGTLDITENQE